MKAADFPIAAIQKVDEKSKTRHPLIAETKENSSVIEALESGEARLAAGTAWLWARDEFEGSIDTLFVDEAGQMSLADVLAVSQAATRIILLGDPQQLEQPLVPLLRDQWCRVLHRAPPEWLIRT